MAYAQQPSWPPQAMAHNHYPQGASYLPPQMQQYMFYRHQQLQQQVAAAFGAGAPAVLPYCGAAIGTAVAAGSTPGARYAPAKRLDCASAATCCWSCWCL